jgi:hypothetical protein
MVEVVHYKAERHMIEKVEGHRMIELQVAGWNILYLHLVEGVY